MTKNDFQSSIRKSWGVLEQLDLAEHYGNPVSLKWSDGFRDLAYCENTNYVDLYLFGLREACYNILLPDHSYFQFMFSDENLLRYAYYPNPFYAPTNEEGSFNDLKRKFDASEIDIEEYHFLLNEAQPEIRAPLIRYENAPRQWAGLSHPCSHLHIGFHSSNRWALQRVLTPLAFVLIILKQYYSEQWQKFGKDSMSANVNKYDDILISEKLNCRILGEDLFSGVEKSSFYFS